MDAEGKKHDWRTDITAALAKRQQADGSWRNERPLDGRRPEPGDRLRTHGSELLQTEEVGRAACPRTPASRTSSSSKTA